LISRPRRHASFFSLCVLALFLCHGFAAGEKLQVVATTSLLGCAASRVGGDRVNVTVLVPPGSCPGHFDMKPSEARSIEDCDILLRHGFESFLPESLPGSVSDVRVKTTANEMTPESQEEIAKSVAGAFSSAAPEEKKYFHEQTEAYLAGLKKAAGRIRGEAAEAGVEDIPVAASVRLVGFLNWMGFKKILAFCISEEMTPAVMGELIDRAKEMQVALVMDNRQSGSSTGMPIARETKAAHLVLSFFPGEEGYIDGLEKNAGKVLEEVRKWKEKRL
jgi:zinc transport system substrate-binding protein